MPGWRDDAAVAVDQWIAAEGRGHQRPRREPLGEARSDGDGWYSVDLRGRQVNVDGLTGLELAPATGAPAAPIRSWRPSRKERSCGCASPGTSPRPG